MNSDTEANRTVIDELYGRKRRTGAQRWVAAGAIFNALILVVGLTAATSRTLGGASAPKAMGSFGGAIKPGTTARLSLTMDMSSNGKPLGLMQMEGEIAYQKAFHAKYTRAPKQFKGMEFWAFGNKGWARAPATRGLLVSFPVERGAQASLELTEIKKSLPGIRRVGSEVIGGTMLDHWVAPASPPPGMKDLGQRMTMTGSFEFWTSPVDRLVRISKAEVTTSFADAGSQSNYGSRGSNGSQSSYGAPASAVPRSFTMKMAMQVFDVGTGVRVVAPADSSRAITQARFRQMLEDPHAAEATYGTQGSIVALGSMMDSFSKSGVQGFTGAFASL